ncbi:hypothetical protein INN71_01540 [Nocardioides sp. ChNu-153]|uniref:hypothetical protein n=1 Tax=Nocardioides sp. ChNu-153 TaxID=2779364 RepID=UPI0026571E02|nr:hypothetical protein [Nocardioides sp. ChNu-153]MDN7120068.1 hypothetical protein [Nocardioides sp. ChNu-153]
MSALRGRRAVLVGVTLVVLVAAVLVVVLVRTTGEGPTPARVGAVVDPTSYAEDEVPTATDQVAVQLPGGAAVLRIGDTVARLPDATGTEQPGVPAPEDGTWLPVSWQWTEWTQRPALGVYQGAPVAVTPDTAPSPTLTLLVDGERHPLRVGEPAVPRSQPDGAWFHVAVPADRTVDLGLAVGWDGEEQVVEVAPGRLELSDPGRFAAYDDYDRSDERTTPVAVLPGSTGTDFAFLLPGTPTDPLDGDLSVVAAYREPYVTGLGWAPAGRTWAVLPLDLYVAGELEDGDRSVTIGSRSWSLYEARPDIRVGVAGEEPVAPAAYRPPTEPVASVGVVVVDVPQDATTVRLDVAARTPVREVRTGDPAGVPDAFTLTWAGDVPLT